MTTRAFSTLTVCAAALCLGAAGCRTPVSITMPPANVALPVWLTAPEDAEQAQAPCSLGMTLPPHLEPYAREYELPAWAVYGVVRSLGADELLVNGTFRLFILRDRAGESRVQVDKVHYDVATDRTRAELGRLAGALAGAQDEAARLDVLGRHVRRRCGQFILFALEPETPPPGQPCEGARLLAGSGQSDTPLERFDVTRPPAQDHTGWRETPDAFVMTTPGEFRYGDPLGTLRATEEEAIYDLARAMVLKFSQLRKDAYAGTGPDGRDDVVEEVYKEEVRLRLRGVRVTRRIVDMKSGICLVTVTLPKSGVSTR
jgi:hypothetical protein